MGSYLRDVCDGDIRRRREIGPLEEELKHGGHARRVMASYEKWLGEGPELAVLRILGLFNRPADKKSVDAVRATPAILGLTDSLQGLPEVKWQQALAKLRWAGLLAAKGENEPDTLDAHPLVREHFGQQLKRDNPAAWREGHRRLYEHLKSTAKKYPETIEEMTPLYAAVGHGCEAGLHQQALDEVFDARIRRGSKHFSIKVLGAVGADLAALASFFDSPWVTPVMALSEADKGFVRMCAGFSLRAVGRLAEAAEPMKASLESAKSSGEWGNASIAAANVAELYASLGQLQTAQDYAREAVEFADRSGDQFQSFTKRTLLAHALSNLGRVGEQLFQQAEELQKEWEPEDPFLYSLQGFQYYALLLEQGKFAEVRQRATRSLEVASKNRWLLDIALDNLSLGRACLLKAQAKGSSDYSEAEKHLNRTVDGLRQAARHDYLTVGLLGRAELYRVKKDFSRAEADLSGAMSLARRGGMRLYEADIHLGHARLYVAQGEKEKARQSWTTAKKMIEEMEYHRRDKDLKEIEEQLRSMK